MSVFSQILCTITLIDVVKSLPPLMLPDETFLPTDYETNTVVSEYL